MKLHTNAQRWITGVLLAAVLASTLVPVAEAGNHGRVRYKGSYGGGYRGGYQVRTYRSPGSTYYVRRSSAGPVIAGFLGGLFLGATLAHAAPAGYTYYDPYCQQRFASIDAYDTYYRRHRFHHPRVVRVIEIRTNTCVKEYRYGDRGWSDDGYRGDPYRVERDSRDDRDYRDDRGYQNDDRGYQNDDRDYQDEDGE